MTDAKTKDIVANPGKQFAPPAEVVPASLLSEKEKASALEQWELDARLMQDATEEGTAGTEPSKLIDVTNAQSALGIEALNKNDDIRGPNKTGM